MYFFSFYQPLKRGKLLVYVQFSMRFRHVLFHALPSWVLSALTSHPYPSFLYYILSHTDLDLTSYTFRSKLSYLPFYSYNHQHYFSFVYSTLLYSIQLQPPPLICSVLQEDTRVCPILTAASFRVCHLALP